MSLHALAQHMQAKGRNDDSMLVHMTPKEVGGLQALAMAHGGSLTINPQTGLPEAGFLSKLLPTLIGAGLTIFSGGAINPLMAAGIVGGGTGLATGSLEKGLMAGLGAYGGAGLGAGITGTAANAVPAAATTSAPATMSANSAISTNASSLANNVANGTTGATTQIANAAAQPTWYNPATWTSSADKFIPGMQASFGNGMEGLKALYGNLPTGTLPALGAYAMMGDEKAPPPAPNPGMIRPYTLEREQNQDAYKVDNNGQRMPVNALGTPMDSRERMWFKDKWTAGTPYKAPGPEYAADGGLMGMAMGGEAEQKAALQSVGMNANYPMAQIDMPMYTVPQMSRPMAREVVNPSGDVGVDQFTGEPRMAGGGLTAFGGGGFAEPQSSSPTRDYKYNQGDMTYTETTRTPPPQMGGKDSPLRRALGQAGMGQPGPAYTGGLGGFLRNIANQAQPQPTETVRTIGGMSDPYVPQTQIQSSPQTDIAQYAMGGIADLGGYSDGGRLLRGPGDGVSDSIPASIGDRQPARLADGEFVIPARIVSEIGNGSTEAGARKLYKMMDRVQHARSKTVGKHQVAKNTNAEKLLPA